MAGFFGLLTVAAKAIGKVSPTRIKAFGGAVSSIIQGASGLTSAADAFNKALEPLVNLIRPITEILTVFGKMLSASLAPSIQKLYDVFFSEKVMNAMSLMADRIGQALVPVFDALLYVLNTLIDSGVFERIFDAILDAMVPVLLLLATVLIKLADSGVFEKIIEAFAGITVILIDLLAGILTQLIDSGLLDLLIAFFTGIFTAIGWVMQWLQDSGVIDAIIFVFGKIFEGIVWFFTHLDVIWNEIVNFFMFIWTAISDSFSQFVGTIVNIWNFIMSIVLGFLDFWGGIGHAIGTIFKSIGDFFVAFWNALVAGFQWFGGILSAIWGGITAVFHGFVNALIAVANFFIDIANTISSIFSLGFATAIPHIPYLDVGGPILKTGVAVVHAGEEVVTAQTVGAIRDMLSALTGMRGEVQQKSYNTNINAVVLDNENAEILARAVYKQQLLFD